MLFVEPFFLLVFLPLALLAFYAAARRFGMHGALTVLFAASCIFYAKWGLFYFALMMLGTLINFSVASQLIASRPLSNAARNWLLAAGQSYNFGTLLYFKYVPYLVFVLTGTGNAMMQLAIPIGISFYTFQQAVFLMDAHARNESVVAYLGHTDDARGTARALLRYGAFHCFFPQLVIGPIMYMSEFAPQVLNRAFGKLRCVDIEVGATLLVIGLFKKVVLADNLSNIVDPAFSAIHGGATLTAPLTWAAALAYFAQLYFDFSGYSDMALGIARLFGLRLPINFDSPLRATGIVDFYRRWHITLTRVIARFLFTPLSIWGTRLAMSRRKTGLIRKFLSSWLAMWLNFEVIALWHGPLPTFLLFGLIHGTWFIIENETKATRAWRRYKAWMPEARRHAIGRILTFLPLMLTFALFRSPSLSDFGRVIQGLFLGGHAEAFGLRLQAGVWALILGAFVVIWLLPNSYELLRRYRPGIRAWATTSSTPGGLRFAWRPNPIWGIVIATLGIVALLYTNREAPFIYMGF